MSTTTSRLPEENVIAYNSELREQLQSLHTMLGLEMTDVATEAMEYGFHLRVEASEVLKKLSHMAAQLSIALQKARQTRDTLTAEEKADYEKIKRLASLSGNLQDQLNRIIKLIKEEVAINDKIRERGNVFAEYIVEAQKEFRDVRANINAYGFLSKNPELSYLFDRETEQKAN